MNPPHSAVPGGGVLLEPTPVGAARRTTTIVITPHGDWASGQRVSAIGRDLIRTADGRTHTENDGFSFDVDAAGLIVPDTGVRSVPEELRGQSARRGLRKILAELHTVPGGSDLGPAGGLYDSMLDDIVGTTLASGYGRLHEGNGRSGSEISTALRLNCLGFNTMDERGEEFDIQRYFGRKPLSVEFADDLSWHHDHPMQANTFRRRRMLQVMPGAAGEVAVTGYFRDTFMRPDGAEVIVHEYGLEATASGRPLVLDSIEATPGSLPLDHCPLAARSALSLAGLPLSEVEQAVRRDIAGPAGCTHLNDELRSLRLVPALLTQLVEATGDLS